MRENFVSFDNERSKARDKEELEIMSHAKQWYETENAKAQFEDYPPITKKNALDSVRYAKRAVRVSVIRLYN